MKGIKKSIFKPKYPDKYDGEYPIVCRSSWENTVAKFLDNNAMEWMSESNKIPYFNPLTNKNTVYVPDFLVRFKDNTGAIRTEMWEVKPYKETCMEGAGKSQKNKLAVIVNLAKWDAAKKWCSLRDITFRIITEHDIFRNPSKAGKK